MMHTTTRILNGEPDLIHVDDFYARYRSNYIGAELVQRLHDCSIRNRDRAVALAALATDRAKWESQGGYIEPLTKSDIAEWVLSDLAIVAETVAHSANGVKKAIAQCVLLLPPESSRCELLVPLLDEAHDEIEATDLHLAIKRSCPSTTAVIDFFGVLSEYTEGNHAADARFAAAQQLVAINKRRAASHQIALVVGLRFQILGISSSKGAAIMLADLGQSPISNHATKWSVRWPEQRLGTALAAKDIPATTLENHKYSIKANWSYWVRRVADIEQRPILDIQPATRCR